MNAAGQPLAGIRVRPRAVLWAGLEREAITGPDGRYELRGLGAGAFRLRFTDPARSHAPRYYRDTSLVAAAEPVTVTLAARIEGIDVRLPVGGSIAGRITNLATGAPASPGWLWAYRIPVLDQEVDYATASVDAEGRYAVAGLAGGNYRLCLRGMGVQDACRIVDVVEGRTLALDLALPPASWEEDAWQRRWLPLSR
jgi:hypothetical protein